MVPAARVPARRAWLEAAAATLALGIAVAVWAAAVSGPLDEADLPRSSSWVLLGPWLLHRLALVSIQQVGLQVLLWPRLREVLGSGKAATAVLAVIFGLWHLPSLPLAVATAVGAVAWLRLYRRGRRLAPLIASHLVLVSMVSMLPDRLFYDLEVGVSGLEVAARQRLLAGDERRALLTAVAAPSYAAHTGGTDAGYVEGLYRDLLGRLATAEEVRDGVEQLASTTRLGLAKRLLLSEEIDGETLWHRQLDDEPLAPGVEITPGSVADFTGWYAADRDWRWARDPEPSIRFRLEHEPERVYTLAISAGAASPVAVDLDLNGRVVGQARFPDFTPLDYRFVIDTEDLAAEGGQELRFLISAEPVVLEGDPRALTLGLRHLRLAPLRFPSAAMLHIDDDYFLEGFSIAEQNLRWTREPMARLVYPLRAIVPAGCYGLRLRAGAFGRQEVEVAINGRSIAEWTFNGIEPRTHTVRFDPELLRAGVNLVDFSIPGAARPEGDPRRLGLALFSIWIYPVRDVASCRIDQPSSGSS